MAMIYKTTMKPGKTELLTAWLPTRPWYASTGHAPELDRSGGFRLDDPEGEVGIEFMVLTDHSGGRETSYLVPLTYRGAPLDGAGAALVGTSEHGVLGTRWIYDGAHDPVLVGQLLALLQGRAVAQDQCDSGVSDPSVTPWFAGPELPADLPRGRPDVTDTARGTDVRLPGAPVLTLTRVLRPGDSGPQDTTAAAGGLTAGWTTLDGAAYRGVFVELHTAGDAAF
ncbi:maltokinase N-terminal cap-like domain-containing protein [Streptomyces sp. NBC_01264]|uniref:maltokinase N-terminal cap-like domain-containing protein n=1 Tax=Streptomyces sp. NBC_01264 TaxID=2903804 RepID=UPI0022517A23|nr:1,4-alpha-glucan branching protein [Streptomyces sp. NBC_01264]MCX4782775.1 1,4-alpha-glucan branching protein [Streptomyces sp. NBC_01264]